MISWYLGDGTFEPSARQIFIAAVLIAGVLYVNWRAHRRRVGRAGPRDAAIGSDGASGIREEMDGLTDELSAMSRRIDVQMEERLSRLNKLIAAADERIARLESFTDSRNETAAHVPEAQPTSGENAGRREIYAMADAGLRAAEIARRTGRMTGEVELILNLRTRESATGRV